MVGEDAEFSGFDHVPKVPHRSVHRQEFTVERALLALSEAEFLLEKLERLPGAFNMLL